MFGVLLMDLLFFGIPAAAGVFFAISLYRYISAKKQNKRDPGCIRPGELKKRKMLLLAASVILGVFLLVVVGFATLLFMAVAFM